MSALRAAAVSVRYGGVVALSEVSLDLEPGEIVGLIGPNGAGKTTFIDAVSGFVRCRGSVRLGEREVARLGACRRARLGLRRTWQAGELFDDLTAEENLTVAARGGSLAELLRSKLRRSSVSDAGDVIELLGLASAAGSYPSELSQGQQKLLGVGRALVGDPHVVLLDEPAAGLDTQESGEFGEHLTAIARTGPAILLVEHDLDLVVSICDRIVVLDFGKVIAQGTPEQIRSDPAVIAAYIGTDELPASDAGADAA